MSRPGLQIGCLLACLSACGRPRDTGVPNAPPGEVWISPAQLHSAHIATEVVRPQPIRDVIPASGKITFDALKVAHLFSPVTGRITKIDAALGQHVKKGDPLCTIESPDVGTASADLDKAQADMVAAAHGFQRQKELYAAHASSQREYEAAQDAFLKARAELERARQKTRLWQAGSANAVTQTYVMRAPIEGDVVARNVNPGAEVAGLYSGGTPVELYTIGSLDPVWVLAEIFEVDLPRVHRGEDVEVEVVTYPGRAFHGTVDWVADALDPTTHTAKARCTIDNPEHLLRPEMFATIRILSAPHQALVVPRAALLLQGDATVVFVEQGRAGPDDSLLRFVRRPVVALQDEPGDLVPIQRGLSPGETIATQGAILMLGMD